MTSKQKAGLVLVGAAALILAAATLTRTWFRTDFGLATSEWGLLSRKNCAAETCSTTSIGELSERHGTYVLASRATFGLGLASVALLGLLALLGVRRHEKVVITGKLALLSLIVTILAALMVMIKKPQVANPSLGVFLFMLAGMGGVIGAQLLSSRGTYDETVRDPSIPRL